MVNGQIVDVPFVILDGPNSSNGKVVLLLFLAYLWLSFLNPKFGFWGWWRKREISPKRKRGSLSVSTKLWKSRPQNYHNRFVKSSKPVKNFWKLSHWDLTFSSIFSQSVSGLWFCFRILDLKRGGRVRDQRRRWTFGILLWKRLRKCSPRYNGEA